MLGVGPHTGLRGFVNSRGYRPQLLLVLKIEHVPLLKLGSDLIPLLFVYLSLYVFQRLFHLEMLSNHTIGVLVLLHNKWGDRLVQILLRDGSVVVPGIFYFIN